MYSDIIDTKFDKYSIYTGVSNMEKCFFLVWMSKSGREQILKIIRMKQCRLSLDHEYILENMERATKNKINDAYLIISLL